MLQGLIKATLICAVSLGSITACDASTQTLDTTLQSTHAETFNLPRKTAHEPIRTLTIPLRGQNRTLELRPYSVRSRKFKVLVDQDGKLEPAAVCNMTNNSFRGHIPSMPDAFAAASYCNDGWHIRILLENGEEYWLEPAEALSGLVHAQPHQAAQRTRTEQSHVMYSSKDVVATPRTCQSLYPPTHSQKLSKRGAKDEKNAASTRRLAFAQTGVETIQPISTELALAEPTANADKLLIADIACDADYEFFVSNGADINATIARIESIINSINVQFERDVGITHRISTIIVRSSPNDPYTQTHSHELIKEFRSHWIFNHSDVERDIAHLFTGRNLQGDSIGVSYVGSICHPGYAYGLSQANFSNNYSTITNLVAHELGHSWSAQHCNCPNYTMHNYSNSSNVFHASATIPQILAFRDQLACLDAVPATPPAAPAGLLANVVDHTTTDLTWQDQASTELGTRIERSRSGEPWVTVATVDENVTTHRDVELTPATHYVYRVSAYNIAGESEVSNIASALTPAAPFLFAGDTPYNVDSGWYASSWLGNYWSNGGAWFYHDGLGFITVAAASSTSDAHDFWFLHLDMGWVWTSQAIWPYCYVKNKSTWYYSKQDRSGVNQFHRVATMVENNNSHIAHTQ